MSTVVVSRNAVENLGRDYLSPFLGKEILYETGNGKETIIGTVQESPLEFGRRFITNKGETIYVVVSFADGNWAPLPWQFETVEELV
jgi:hypothetical protein